ncbi:hypothetical protein TH8_08485 [Thalassospira profundimaris]|nr:hypothetical protein TH8_08485 [Thalassospira profundimaris]
MFLRLREKIVSCFGSQTVASDNLGDLVKQAALSHRQGVISLAEAREKLRKIYPNMVDEDDSILQSLVLNEKIDQVLERYRNDENVYKYFYGYPYQSLNIANVFGDRVCDYRFDEYELSKFISPSDRVLDVGCNCGFMALLASYRTGCFSVGLDINPYMIEIGQLTSEFLRIQDITELYCKKIQDYYPGILFNVVFSFATHWTDDQNYRVSLRSHLERMASYLEVGGVLLFESHCNDIGSEDFYKVVEGARDIFDFNGCYKKTDSGSREYYVMKKK